MQKLKWVRTVFFDSGHTLLFPDYGVYLSILREFDTTVTYEEFKRIENETRMEFESNFSSLDSNKLLFFYTTLFRKLGLRDEETTSAYHRVIEENKKGIGIFRILNKEAIPILERLKTRYKLGVISNADGRLKEAFKALGIYGYFDVLVDSEIVKIEKPNPGIFRIALEATNSSPMETVHIGDYYCTDIKGAETVGIKPILYDPENLYTEYNGIKIRKLQEVTYLLDSGELPHDLHSRD